jgi:hypothetical protein
VDHAEVRNKVPEGVREDEDVLTSTVFGLLELLPPLRVLLPWLCLARDLSDRNPPLDAGSERASFAYWPRFPELGDRTELDLLLALHRSDGTADLVGVEVKYQCGPSGWPTAREIAPDVQGQLGREWQVISRLAPERAPGEPSQVRSRWLLYITPEPSKPRRVMRSMVDEVKAKSGPDGMAKGLFWLSWLDLWPLVLQAAMEGRASGIELQILNRLKAYLRSRRIVSFGGMERPRVIPRVSWRFTSRLFSWSVASPRVRWAYGSGESE